MSKNRKSRRKRQRRGRRKSRRGGDPSPVIYPFNGPSPSLVDIAAKINEIIKAEGNWVVPPASAAGAPPPPAAAAETRGMGGENHRGGVRDKSRMVWKKSRRKSPKSLQKTIKKKSAFNLKSLKGALPGLHTPRRKARREASSPSTPTSG